MKRSNGNELSNKIEKKLKIIHPDDITSFKNYPICEGIKKEFDKKNIKLLDELTDTFDIILVSNINSN